MKGEIMGRLTRRDLLKVVVPVGVGGVTSTDRSGATLLPSVATAQDNISQVARLTADYDSEDVRFGTSVALSSSGDTGLVGAAGGVLARGGAHVFESSSGSWNRQVKFRPDRVSFDISDTFGASVAISSDGSTAFVNDWDGDSNVPGSVYVFNLSNGSWDRQTKLAPDDGSDDDEFGSAVAVSDDGTIALVGVPGYKNPSGEKVGSAYVFEYTEGVWDQQAKITRDHGTAEDGFGESVAMSGDGTTVLIAAKEENPNGFDSGATYVFEATDESWDQRAQLTPYDGDSRDKFGESVALSKSGATAIIGAKSGGTKGDTPGSVYVFEANGDSWGQRAKLTPDDGDSEDEFGSAVAVSDDSTTAVIGAPFNTDTDRESVGAAYLFESTNGAWDQRGKITPDSGSANRFGNAVAVSSDGSDSLIGAYKSANDSGSAYVFQYSDGEQATETPSETATPTPTEETTTSRTAPDTQTQAPTNVNLALTGQQTTVTLEQTAHITFSAVNLVGNDSLTVQLIIETPSGVNVQSVDNAESGSNQYTADFTLQPGESRNVRVALSANERGQHDVTGIAAYYFGEQSERRRRFSRTIQLTVGPETTDASPTGATGPGFSLLSTLLGSGFLGYRYLTSTDDNDGDDLP